MLLPVYTPTRTDEPNVSEPRVLFGGLSVYLQQRFPLFRHSPRLIDRLLDAPAVIRALTARSVKTDPRMLGDLTVSMLEGEQGALRKEFGKLVDWIRHEAPVDVINLPNSLLIAMARPLSESARPAGLLHAAGGGTVSWRPLAPLPGPRTGAHPAAGAARRSVHCGQRLLRAVHERSSSRFHRRRWPSCRLGFGPTATGAASAADDVFRVGYFARIAPEKGLHVLADAWIRFRRRIGDAPARLEAAGYLAAADRSYLDGVKRTLARAPVSSTTSRIAGKWTGTGKLAFLGGT